MYDIITRDMLWSLLWTTTMCMFLSVLLFMVHMIQPELHSVTVWHGATVKKLFTHYTLKWKYSFSYWQSYTSCVWIMGWLQWLDLCVSTKSIYHHLGPEKSGMSTCVELLSGNILRLRHLVDESHFEEPYVCCHIHFCFQWIQFQTASFAHTATFVYRQVEKWNTLQWLKVLIR